MSWLYFVSTGLDFFMLRSDPSRTSAWLNIIGLFCLQAIFVSVLNRVGLPAICLLLLLLLLLSFLFLFLCISLSLDMSFFPTCGWGGCV